MTVTLLITGANLTEPPFIIEQEPTPEKQAKCSSPTKPTCSLFADPQLWIIAILAFLAQIAFALCLPSKAISIDLRSWGLVADLLMQGENPYVATSVLCWPPVWMQLIYLFKKVSILTGLDFPHVVRGFLSLVEIATLITFAYIAKVQLGITNWKRLLFFGFAINPIYLLLIGMHANFDPLVGLWILLLVLSAIEYLKSNNQTAWLFACLFIGLGILTKTTPLILIPLLSIRFNLLKLETKLLGAIMLFLPVTLGMSILYVLSPEDITEKVIQYRSLSGYFGFSGILKYFQLDASLAIFECAIYLVIIASFCLIPWLLKKRPKLSDLSFIRLTLLCFLSIVLFGPGYGPQYITWFFPLILLLYGHSFSWQKHIFTIYFLIAALTFIFEYSFFGSHGKLLLHLFPNPKIIDFSHWVSTAHMQTLIRFPIFLCYLAIFVSLLLNLHSNDCTRVKR